MRKLFLRSLVGAILFTCAVQGIPESHIQDDPFQFSQLHYSPSTYGLPIGSPAPPLPGVDFSQRPTLLVVVNQYSTPYLVPVLVDLLPTGAQLVVVGHELSRHTSVELAERLGERVKVILDPEAFYYCALYRVGPGPVTSPLAFLIDTSGTIVHRQFGVRWLAYRDAHLAHQFATQGDLPPETVPQHVFWEGDALPWPQFPLTDPAGTPRQLGPGRPMFFLFGAPALSSPRGALLFALLERLRREFPEITFVWVVDSYSDSFLEDGYRLHHRLGLEMMDHSLLLGLAEYMEQARTRRDQVFSQLVADVRQNAPGWEVLVQEDRELYVLWGIRMLPGILLVDAQGRVVLPHTGLPYRREPETGEIFLHPRLLEGLWEALGEARRTWNDSP